LSFAYAKRMITMSDDLRTRIAAVLSKHRIYHRAFTTGPVPLDWGCSCYEWQGKSADHDLHQADVVIAELGIYEDEMGTGPPAAPESSVTGRSRE
jgi:hypothetical protein